LIARVHELAGGEVNPPTGNIVLDPDKFYYIIRTDIPSDGQPFQTQYLTVYSEGDKPSNIDNKYFYKNSNGYSKETENFICADVRLKCDNSSMKAGNVRQLFRFNNNRLYPACSNLGKGKVVTVTQNGIDTGLLVLDNYNSSDMSQSIEIIPANSSSFFIKINSKYMSTVRYKKPTDNDDATIRRPFNHRLKLDSMYSNDESLWLIKEYDDEQLNEFDNMDSSKYATELFNNRKYIKVTQMPLTAIEYPNLEEYFHPFSGMVSGTWAENNGNKIDKIIKDFYYAVFHVSPTSKKNYLHSLYGSKTNTVSGDRFNQTMHYGVDIVGPNKNATVYSAHSGNITIAGGNYGQVGIYDSSNDVTYFYLHLKDIPEEIQVGGIINKNQIIGVQSNTGVKDIHLHFEVRKGYRSDVGEDLPKQDTTIPLESLFSYPYM